MEQQFMYIYGPVPSWRIGSSLGIDLLSRADKICSFDCTYCQLGRTLTRQTERKVFVPVENVLEEIRLLPEISIDYFTFSGRGEPTLASNLGEAIRALKAIRQTKIAVITNASLIWQEDVQKDLLAADLVIAKLDAPSEEIFAAINRPAEGLRLGDILGGLVDFRKSFPGKFALQVMFIEQNKGHAAEIASLYRTIAPDEVQINTPLRPCAVEPLGREELSRIKDLFNGLNTLSVYESHKIQVKPISDDDTLRRRGKV
jgi:wyosine [tRNA(Phe)-imidazoG37] synthetase (radical SAM superfamily)